VVNAVEATAVDPVVDRSRTKSDPHQLVSADDGMPAASDLDELRLSALVGGFPLIIRGFPPTSSHEPDDGSRTRTDGQRTLPPQRFMGNETEKSARREPKSTL
jgi:hypothetical protein